MEVLGKVLRGVVAAVKREPVIVLYGLSLAVSATALFGLDLDTEQVASVQAVVTLVLTLWTRQKVTPVSKLEPMTTSEFLETYGPGVVDDITDALDEE